MIEKIQPYNTLEEALSELDNGGYFYNLFTSANDGVISEGELRKIAGVFEEKRKLILLLELLLSKLRPEDKATLLSKLDDALLASYEDFKPRYVRTESIEEQDYGTNIILQGVPKFVDSTSHFKGFIMTPIVTGKMLNHSMVPITEKYEVYEITTARSAPSLTVAHAKSTVTLPEEIITIGGILKEMKRDENTTTDYDKFVEVIYWMGE